jgi:hypothetical protein
MTNLGASAQRHDVQVRKDPEKELLGQFPVNQGFVGLGKDPACTFENDFFFRRQI